MRRWLLLKEEINNFKYKKGNSLDNNLEPNVQYLKTIYDQIGQVGTDVLHFDSVRHVFD